MSDECPDYGPGGLSAFFMNTLLSPDLTKEQKGEVCAAVEQAAKWYQTYCGMQDKKVDFDNMSEDDVLAMVDLCGELSELGVAHD